MKSDSSPPIIRTTHSMPSEPFFPRTLPLSRSQSTGSHDESDPFSFDQPFPNSFLIEEDDEQQVSDSLSLPHIDESIPVRRRSSNLSRQLNARKYSGPADVQSSGQVSSPSSSEYSVSSGSVGSSPNMRIRSSLIAIAADYPSGSRRDVDSPSPNAVRASLCDLSRSGQRSGQRPNVGVSFSNVLSSDMLPHGSGSSRIDIPSGRSKRAISQVVSEWSPRSQTPPMASLYSGAVASSAPPVHLNGFRRSTSVFFLSDYAVPTKTGYSTPKKLPYQQKRRTRFDSRNLHSLEVSERQRQKVTILTQSELCLCVCSTV